MIQRDHEQVLDEISREQLPQDLHLLPGIMAKIEQGNRPTMFTTTKFRLSALAFAVVLLIALFSLPGVASALRGLIGYIPGVGRVDQSVPLRVLASPVTDTRDGYTITIDSAVLDASRTVLNYRVSGEIPSWDHPMLQPRMCADSSILRLPDGKELTYPSRVRSSGGSGVTVSTWQDIFPAVPADINSAVLVLPCLGELPEGEGPTNWEIPLAFAPAPPDMTVFPVVEPVTPMPTPLPATQTPVAAAPESTETAPPTATAAAAATPSADGMQLSLEGIAALDEGYYLQTVLRWGAEPSFYDIEIHPDAVHLFDASNQEVPVWLADQISPMAQADAGSLPLNLQTGPITVGGPARLVLDFVAVGMPADVHFTIDIGSNPQPGQVWEVNQDLEINGHALRVKSAEYIQTPPDQPVMLLLNLEADSDIYYVIAGDLEHEFNGSAGAPNNPDVPFRAGWYYKNGMPEGTINVTISWITIRRAGPWEVTWTPTAPDGTLIPPPKPTAQGVCPDVPTNAAGLPEGLGGKVIYTGAGEKLDLYLSNLDGSNPIAVGTGLIPDLSPDGKRVVYRALEGGLYMREVGGSESILISGPVQENVFEIWPKWSPDGQLIAFDRTVNHLSDIYVANADGTNLGPLLATPEDESLLGWSPDGQQIYYRWTTPDGQRVFRFDRATGRSLQVGQVPLDAGQISLSPDAKRLVYITEQGIFLSPLDGGATVTLTGNGKDFGNPVWSPNGQWIILNYWDAADNSTPSQALLQPDTCQFLRVELPLGAIIQAWGQ